MTHKSIFLNCFLLICFWANSQQLFIPHNVTYGSRPGDISLVDFDNDSDLDILAYYYYDGLLAWHRNDGIGHFDSLIVIDHCDLIMIGGYATDIDNDGNMDVVLGGANDVRWYKNLGSGIFGPAQIICNVLNKTAPVMSFDLDNDNLIDIVGVCNTDSNIVWYKNLGFGNFGTQQILTTTTADVRRINASDLDLDGKTDILYTMYNDDKVSWHKNLGGGSFGAEQIIANNAEGAYWAMAANIDSDTLPDVIASHSQVSGSLEKVTWYKNLGNGSFSSEMVINNSLEVPKYFYPADFDNDNDLDLLLTSWNQDMLLWQENQSNGSFGPMQLISNTINNPDGVCSGDLDGDGFMDIVAGSEGSSSIQIFMNNKNGGFDSTQTIAFASANPWCVYADDLDNDGLKDILSASETDNKIAWYKNLGNKQFSLQKVISTSRSRTRSLDVGDFDNDGYKDIVSTAFDENDTLAWQKNLGNGTFGEPITIQFAPSTKIVRTRDLNNDGFNDLVFYMNQFVYSAKNMGNGNFGTPQFLHYLVGVTTLEIDDVNNDSFPDIVFGSGSTLALGINDGSGNFLAVQNINISNGARDLWIDDINDDGFKDLVITDNVGSNRIVAWYPNDGSGSFSSWVFLSNLPSSSYTVCTSDIDNDGDSDIVTATSGYSITGVVYWFENLGNGSFDTIQVIDTLGGNMWSIFPSDMDSDGDNDILIAQNGYSKVMWLENNLCHWLDTVTVCAGDSALIFGDYQNQTGNYFDTLQSIQGNDSINIIRLEHYPSYHTYDTVEICEGEPYWFNGQVLDTSGVYSATVQSVDGCDSIVELLLTVVTAPPVSMSLYNPDSVGVQSGPIALPLVYPSGGNFSGTGVIANGFDPALAGLGEHYTTYTVVDTATGCTSSDSARIRVYDPIGIDEIENSKIKLYPNPGTGDFVLSGTNLQSVQVKTLAGELVKEVAIKNRKEIHFNLTGLAKGTYLVHIVNEGIEIKRMLVLM